MRGFSSISNLVSDVGTAFSWNGRAKLPVGIKVEIPIEDESPFADLLRIAEEFPVDPDWPADFAA